jgi:hypothetical protein
MMREECDVKFPQWLVDRVLARQGILHPYDVLDATRTAFVVVDLQNYYTQPGFQGQCAAAPATFAAVNRLANALRAAGGLVASPPSYVDAGTQRASAARAECRP